MIVPDVQTRRKSAGTLFAASRSSRVIFFFSTFFFLNVSFKTSRNIPSQSVWHDISNAQDYLQGVSVAVFEAFSRRFLSEGNHHGVVHDHGCLIE